MFLEYINSEIGLIEINATESKLTSVIFVDQQSAPTNGNLITQNTCKQLQQYFSGTRKTFDLPLDSQGTDFQTQVWQALLNIPFGQLASYRDIAYSIKNPKAVRAVGAANGKNPISIIVPCHRVIGSDGTLTGYAGGLDKKKWLLKHEEKFIFS